MYDIEKIKTIGATYMVVSGLPKPEVPSDQYATGRRKSKFHAAAAMASESPESVKPHYVRLALFGIAVIQRLTMLNEEFGTNYTCRIGIDSKFPFFCLCFGGNL